MHLSVQTRLSSWVLAMGAEVTNNFDGTITTVVSNNIFNDKCRVSQIGDPEQSQTAKLLFFVKLRIQVKFTWTVSWASDLP